MRGFQNIFFFLIMLHGAGAVQEDHLQNSGFHLKDKNIKCY
jgi:hypothetical protein